MVGLLFLGLPVIFEVEGVGEFVEWTVAAFGFWFAELFAETYEQAVILVEHFCVGGQVRLEQFAELFVIGAWFNQFVPDGHSGGVSIYDKKRSFESVE